MEQTLAGLTILVTRAGEQAGELRDLLAERGARVLEQPGIQVTPPSDWAAVDLAIDRLEEFGWVVFSSANGVRYFLDRVIARTGNCLALHAHKLAAIGPATARELTRYGLTADVVPGEYRAETFAAALVPHAVGNRFLLVRANRGRDVLPNELVAAGAEVEQVAAYATHDVERADPEILAALASGKIAWVTVTSSAIARSIVGLLGDDLRRTRIASISPVTTEALESLGYSPAARAREYTMLGLVEAIERVPLT